MLLLTVLHKIRYKIRFDDAQGFLVVRAPIFVL